MQFPPNIDCDSALDSEKVENSIGLAALELQSFEQSYKEDKEGAFWKKNMDSRILKQGYLPCFC